MYDENGWWRPIDGWEAQLQYGILAVCIIALISLVIYRKKDN